MQKFSNLKFIVDLNKDIEVLNGFLKTAKIFNMEKDLKIGFYDFYSDLEKIIKSKNTQKQKNKLIKSFIQKIYQRDSIQINKAIKDAKRQWQKNKRYFLKKISNLFKNYPWPKGKYVAYPTIWGVYPRFINDKTFFFPYIYKNKNFILFVIMHEMLHFIFYDYAIKKHPEIFRKLDTETGTFWDLAEIFNAIILSLPEFKKLHKQKKIFCYSEHKKYFSKLKKLWQNTMIVDNWLIIGYEYLERQKIN